jgi:amino acid adenylation domain-containing protein/non-ribosomal peptide synthase protein (TIGR01720 family)
MRSFEEQQMKQMVNGAKPEIVIFDQKLLEEKSYWIQKLSGGLEASNLKPDFPRTEAYERQTVDFKLTGDIYDKLLHLTGNGPFLLYTTFMATLKICLYNYTKSGSIVVGSPARRQGGNGHHPDNALAIVDELNDRLSFRQFALNVRQTLLEAYERQRYPFDRLIRDLKIEDASARCPLFDVALVLREIHGELPEVNNDITITFRREADQIAGTVVFRSDLFKRESIKRFVTHYRNVLQTALKDTNTPVSDFRLLSEAERQQVLFQWNDTGRDYPLDRLAHQLVEQQAARAPESIAAIFKGHQLSYKELNERANQLAHYLRQRGVGPEAIVGILMERSTEMLVAMLAVFKAGGAYLPLDPEYPRERLSFMLNDSGAKVLLSQESLRQQLVPDDAPTIFYLDTGWQHVARESSENLTNSATADNLAYVIYTSGSTGTPKGTLIPHSALLNLISWHREQYQLGASDRSTQLAGLGFDASVWELWPVLCAGATLLIADEETRAVPARLRDWLLHEQVTISFVPTPLAEKLLELEWPQSGGLRHMLTGGDRLHRRPVEGLPFALINHYGPTECAVVASAGVVDAGSARGGELPAIGRPIANAQVFILDERMQPVPVGVRGELYIGGRGVGRGYLNRAELTADRFVPHPYSAEPGARLYRTGDLARYLQDGNIEFIDRADEQVKLRGYRIELGEIEAMLRQHAAVREAIVLLREDEPGEKRLVAYVVAEDEQQVTSSLLREHLRTKLPDYMLPHAFVVLDALPLTPNGKVDRRALPVPEQMRAQLGEDFVQPRTPVEEMMAGIWAAVLGVERVGVHDNFFELGGHSLLATQVISQLREVFRVELPLRSIFELRTVARLAESVEAALKKGTALQVPPIKRVPRDRVLPLSFAQQRLWFIDQFEPGSPFYNILIAVRLSGPLNVVALEQTLNEIIRRHEALRTSFETVAGQPVQIIAATATARLSIIDLSEWPEANREAEVQRQANEEARRAFDLSQGPLLRATLLRLDEKEHVILFTMHHIVSDGWSMNVLVREVGTLYEAYLGKHPVHLEELPIQYADYSAWQSEWLQGDVLEEQLSYWRKQLDGAPSVIELPTDRPRPAVQSFRGAQQSVLFSQSLSEKLKALSNQEGVTLFMTLLAAFQALLSRYSGQKEIVVGTPIANRHRAETENLIGFFVNTLVLRSDFAGNPNFRKLLSQTRDVCLGAYAHQDVPFERLVEELQPERSLSHTPLFQVMFALQQAPLALELPDVTLSPLQADSGTSKFDLTLELVDTKQGLAGVLQYSTDLFDAATIKRMLKHFEALLDGLVANPERPIADLPLLTDSERQQLLFQWNDTRQDFLQEQSVSRLFEWQAEQTPESVAVINKAERISYGQLNQRANQLAHYLRELGVGPETIVAILMDRSVEMVISALAILKAGGAYLPLDPEYPQERVSFMLRDAGVKTLLTQKELLPQVPQTLTTVVAVDAQHEEIERQSRENLAASATADNLAYVIYTSGSTGTPKGTLIPHSALLNLISWHREQYQLGASDRSTQLAGLGFDASVWELWPVLCAGATLLIADEETRAVPAKLRDWLLGEQVTISFVPTPLAEKLLELEWPQSGGLRHMLTGGDRLHKRPIEGLPFALINHYGPTECAVVASAGMVNAGGEDGCGWPSIGRPIANVEVYLLDERMQPVPVGVRGELYIGGRGIGRGYLNRPELTAERFIPHPFSAEPGARLYRTGDIARYLADGRIEFIGRADAQVKVRGYRIELGEIEAVLAEHELVREAVALLREDVPGEKRLVAYVVAYDEQQPTNSELRGHLQKQLPAYMIPSAFVMLDELPLTPSGKIDRRSLPAPERVRPELENSYVAPASPTEEILVSIWSDLLNVERVGIHDNFFELGGHSLLATQLISRIRETFHVNLPLRSSFESPTIAEQAQLIERLVMAEDGVEIPLVSRASREEPLPLSFAQQRLWFLDQLEPGTAYYNMPLAVRLSGPLNVLALERTINEIIRRHEVLRTSFKVVEGQTVQVIAPEMVLNLSVEEVGAELEAEREAEVKRIAVTEASQPFDLSTGPLLRVRLLRLSAEEHVILFTMHHIVSDGWSMGVLLREVSTLYKVYSLKQTSPLPELAIQYADYAAWQRELLQGEVLERQLQYWREQLRDVPQVLELPTDRPRPAVQSHRGAREAFLIKKELSESLTALSRTEGVTLFMTLLAGFQALLHRYTGQQDIVVGSDIANRNRGEAEALIGFFVNQLVLRTNFADDPSVRDLLRRVREMTLGAYAHQDVPFEKLVEELQPERSLGHSPLFQVKFILQNAPMGAETTLPGLSLKLLEIDGGTTKLDLTVSLEETPRGVNGVLEYNTDLFDRQTITRMLDHYQRLLKGIAADPEQRLSQLQLLDKLERDRMLVEWNRTQAAYPSDQCFQHLFETQAEKTPDAVALIYGDERLSFDELNRRANQLANYLRALGIGPEVRVGILLERSVEMVIGLLGILKAGGAYVPLDPEYPIERLAFMLEDMQTPVLLTQERLMDELPAHWAQVICLDSDWEAIAQQSEQTILSDASPSNLAYVIYTSGSTGRPKGVMITHQGLVNYLSWATKAYSIAEGKGVPVHSSLAFDLTITSLLAPLVAGQHVVLLKEQEEALTALGDALSSGNSFSLVKITPAHLSVLEQVLQTQTGTPSYPATLVVGGEALSGESLTYWREHAPETLVVNEYGPTETVVGCCVYTRRAVEIGSGAVPIGRPIANTELYILDERLEPVAIGVRGELYIGGRGVGRGYLSRPELTAERFLPHPYSIEPGARLYRTGDIARYLPDGNIEYIGRIDEQVKVRGYRIELGEIEAVLTQHSAVREAVALLREDVFGEKRLVTYVVTSDERQLTSSELRSYLQEQLPAYMIPSAFVPMDELPLTPNGKLDRKALPAPESSLESADKYVAARTPTEELLASIWSEVLRVERVGVNDNFFELGGDSILSVQIIARANRAGLRLTPKQLFQHQTIATLAAAASSSQASLAPQSPISGPLPLTPIQHWFFEQGLINPHHFNQSLLLELSEAVDSTSLEVAVNQLVTHHDALRLRFTQSASGWQQENLLSEPHQVFTVIDLSPLSESELSPTIEAEAEIVQCSLHLTEGPLLRVVLFECGEIEAARLLIVIHHLAVDGVSWRILLEDLQQAYEQVQRGQEVRLSAKTNSYQQWAERLEQYARSTALEAEAGYWSEVAEQQVAPLPVDYTEGSNSYATAESVTVSLGKEETRSLLQEVPSVYHTQINDVLLTALGRALSMWSEQERVLVEMEGHGRESLETEDEEAENGDEGEELDITRTVGWFTTIYPVMLEVQRAGSISEALKHVKEQLRSLPNKGLGYGVLKYLSRKQEIREQMRGVRSEVSFNYLGQVDQVVGEGSLYRAGRESSGAAQDEQGQRAYLLEITAMVAGEELQVSWRYSRELHRRETIERVAESYLQALHEIIAQSGKGEAQSYTPSDFPLAHLNQQELDRLIASTRKT